MSADERAEGEAEEVCRNMAAALGLRPDQVEAHPEARQLRQLIVRMHEFEHSRDDPVREIMARLGDRWSTLLLLILKTGTFRHAMLRRLVTAIAAEKAISQRMLTLRLRALEWDGLVRREVTPTVPPRVDYSLTPMGRELTAAFETLLRWIEARDGQIRQSRRAFEDREREQ